MRKKSFKFLNSIFLLSIFLTLNVFSAPKDTSQFFTQKGGFVELSDGSYIEGSKSYGGIQPDYKVDMQDPALVEFLHQVKKAVNRSFKIHFLKIQGRSIELQNKKIELVTALVQKALPIKLYQAPSYLQILKEHRLNNLDISLGSYLSCQSGVCRENALLTNLALQTVGIKNKYFYASVQQGKHIEDHALVLVQNKNGNWIVDPYNFNFHGKNFDDLMSENTSVRPRIADFAIEPNIIDNIKILKVHNFPTYWIPQFNLYCSKIFNH